MDQMNDGDCVHIGIDFGVSATVIAVRAPGQDYCTLAFPGISREFSTQPGNAPVNLIPSLVEYRNGNVLRLGDEVLRGGTSGDPATARWLRRYICNRSPARIAAGDNHMVRYDDAAAELLSPILTRALQLYSTARLVFTLPHDAPAEYGELLQRIARRAGARSCSTVSEFEAALAGSGCSPVTGEPFIIITFSETDLDVAVIGRDGHADAGCDWLRVYAKAALSYGCRALDGWIVQDLLQKFRLLESDPRAVRLMPQIRNEAARLREQISVAEQSRVQLTDIPSGRTFAADFTASDLEQIITSHNLVGALYGCIDRALSALRIRGADKDLIRQVILLGEGCALPAVQDAVRVKFPKAIVHPDHPLDAVARGAASGKAMTRAEDRIVCSYALRYWDPVSQEHHYRYLVHSGARYPSAGQVARIVISAAYDGQTHLGIPLYAIGSGEGEKGSMPAIELISDMGGGVRLAGPAQDADAQKQVVHANERVPTLLVANPPARKGEPRFECTFSVDPERNLCLTARDLVTGMLVKLNTPVYRLT